MEFKNIERKWQRKWEERALFQSEPDKKRRKFFLTAAFPYPNSPQHIGHARTYTTTDVYARYMRMKGYNVLFPMGFHVTGTPVLAMAKRIAQGDEEIRAIFRNIYEIPEEVIPNLNTPEKLVDYFSNEIEKGMKEMGFSIDWRRKFYTYDLMFNRFIQWQFRKLKERGYITRGEHPVPWCPSCDNAVGAHDTQGDIDPEIEEVVMIKFQLESGENVLCATYRPETTYGVTNIWLNPKTTLALVEIKGERYYIAKDIVDALRMQMELKVLKEVPGKELVGKRCKNPLTGDMVPILPATFVDPKVGSGIVMSVPAHAPYDYLAQRDLEKTEWEGAPSPMKQVLEIEGFGEFPAKEIVERMGIRDQKDPKAEEATHIIYKKEAHTGRMTVGKYKGMPVMEAKERIQEDMVREGKALLKYEIVNGPIRCRCGAVIGVKIVRDQWFIDYGNQGWKDEAKKCLAGMRIIPEKTRKEYEYTIDWLRGKACTRAQGLGTRFPFDETKVIESLSDSTIYMAFYTIAHHLKEVGWERLDDEFFDYVFLGRGNPQNVAKKLGIGRERVEEMRKEFLYWYPHDSRHSAADLIHNHLTFFIFNHIAIFPQELWPRQIVVNGFVLMEGSKMSKSMGNILPLRKAIRKYGADVVRFSVVSGAELSADSDFNQAMIQGIRSRLSFMSDIIEKLRDMEKGVERPIDRWLLSSFNKRMKIASGAMEDLALREVTQEIFYNTISDIKWYIRRGGNNPEILRNVLKKWVLLMSPFTPHVSEELWERLGGEGMACQQAWPEVDESLIDGRVELAEEVVKETRRDVEVICRIIKKKPKKIKIFVAREWKRKLYKLMKEKRNVRDVMSEALKDKEFRKKDKDVLRVVQKLAKEVNQLRDTVLGENEERAVLEDAKEFFSKEFGAEVVIGVEGEAENKEEGRKASSAMPMKPSIFIQ